MKRILLYWLVCFILYSLLCLMSSVSFAQHQPLWTQTMNNLPDSAYLFPVRTVTDAFDNSIVLSAYGVPGGGTNKVVVNKFSSSGQLIWNVTYDHVGTGSPRGWDMAISPAGACYIAGGFMDPPYKCMLMKISPLGNIDWVIDTVSAGVTGNFEQVIIHSNKVYVSGINGIAVFDFNGNELWSKQTNVVRMAVDNLGQAIVSGFNNNGKVERYDSLGNLNFSDSTIEAKRICTDSQNNFFLLSDVPGYSLVKYNAAGTLAWQKDSFPIGGGFGDIGFEVLTDSYDNVIAVGLTDSIFKFSPSGNLLWNRSMNGIDSYRIAVTLFSDFLIVAGSDYFGTQYDAVVGIFNSLGWESWRATYNSNNHQEFSVDVAMTASGFVVLEDSISCSNLLKYTLVSAAGPVDYSLVCVDSVWYDTTNSQLINVRIFNGNIPHMNYPTVRIISPAGDTISNRNNDFSFFAQAGNTLQVYTDSISVQGITDFSGYTFVMGEGHTDFDIIPFCSVLNIDEPEQNDFTIYPNPATDHITIFNRRSSGIEICLFDLSGRLMRIVNLEHGTKDLDISGLSPGLYMVKSNEGYQTVKLLKVGN
jgi:hypothetical protein